MRGRKICVAVAESEKLQACGCYDRTGWTAFRCCPSSPRNPGPPAGVRGGLGESGAVRGPPRASALAPPTSPTVRLLIVRDFVNLPHSLSLGCRSFSTCNTYALLIYERPFACSSQSS